MSNNWTAATSWDEVCRRAGGRRRYNAHRSFRRHYRRYVQVCGLLCKYGLWTWGVQARVARELGISRSTVCPDRAALLRETRPCPHCGAFPRPAVEPLVGTPE